MPARHLVDLAATATRLADAPHLWEPLVDYDPVSRFYARLALTPEHEAWLLTWLPGQGTDWHDHGGSAGAFVVVAVPSPRSTRRRRPDGSAVAGRDPVAGHGVRAALRDVARPQGHATPAWSRR